MEKTTRAEAQPCTAIGYYNRGNTHSIMGNYNQALLDYTEALKLNPKYAKAYNNRGNTHRKQGNYNQALLDFNKALKLNPKYAKAYNNRGFTYGSMGNYNQALLNFNKALKLNPKYADAYNNRGNMYDSMGNYNQALSDYTEALKLNSKNAEAYYNRGLTYYSKGNYKQALLDYTEALKLNSKYADAYNNRGVTYENMKNYKCALQDYLNALFINPNVRITKNNLSKIADYIKTYKQDILEFIKQELLRGIEIKDISILKQYRLLDKDIERLLKQEIIELNNTKSNEVKGIELSAAAIELVEKIGEGGLGQVFIGKWNNTQVAVKRLLNNLGKAEYKQLINEAELLGRLRHPHIVSCYGYTKEPNTQLVLEYVGGGDLCRYIDDSNFKYSLVKDTDWQIRIKLSQDMLSGLAYLHSKEILHRDIKTKNVLIDIKYNGFTATKELTAKLGDFGFAKTRVCKSITSRNSNQYGTYIWAAPELFDNKKASYSSDMYSLSLVLYELNTLKRIYCKERKQAQPGNLTLMAVAIIKLKESMGKVTHQAELEESNIPEPLQTIMQQCWSKPAHRISAQAGLNQLAQFTNYKQKLKKSVTNKTPKHEINSKEPFKHVDKSLN